MAVDPNDSIDELGQPKRRRREAKWGANILRSPTLPGGIGHHDNACDQALSYVGQRPATTQISFASTARWANLLSSTRSQAQ